MAEIIGCILLFMILCVLSHASKTLVSILSELVVWRVQRGQIQSSIKTAQGCAKTSGVVLPTGETVAEKQKEVLDQAKMQVRNRKLN